MKTIIHITETEQRKKILPNGETAKTVFETISKERRLSSEREHKNITNEDTLKFFRRLGGSESVTYSYTAAGYLPTKVVSTSPDKSTRKIYDFDINMH